MPRHRHRDDFTLEDVTDFLVTVPIWVGPILITFTFVLLYYAWPAWFGGDDKMSPLREIGPAIAPYITFGVFVAWIFAEIKKLGRRRLLDTQTGLGSIRALSWQEFERLVGEAYRRKDYIVEETGTRSGDGGIDLILKGHGETVLVQCKQWRERRVGVKPVRELYGVLMSEGADRAILATCGTFTREAQSFAQGKPIQLVSSNELLELVRSAQRPQAQAAVSVQETSKPIAATTKNCPSCGNPMIVRTARRGPKPGSRFWGCSNYPACRTTAPYE